MTDPNMSFRPRPDVRYRLIGTEGVVLRQEAGEVIVVNETGARILDLVKSGAPVAQMAMSISGEYDVEPVAAQRDLNDYLESLVRAGVIEPVDNDGPRP